MKRPDPAPLENRPGETAAPMPLEDIVARIAVIRSLVDPDPARMSALLGSVGPLPPGTRLSTGMPAALALLDELETLVALLARTHGGLAEELHDHGWRRRALEAYRIGRAGS